MALPVSAQALELAAALLWGAGLALGYDLLRALRRSFGLRHLLDGLFCLLVVGALWAFLLYPGAGRLRPAALGPSTVLLILSDAKTVDLPRAEAALARASSLAGSVVWMNPIPENKWPYLNSVQAMLPHCRMVPCSTLNDLARACAKLI